MVKFTSAAFAVTIFAGSALAQSESYYRRSADLEDAYLALREDLEMHFGRELTGLERRGLYQYVEARADDAVVPPHHEHHGAHRGPHNHRHGVPHEQQAPSATEGDVQTNAARSYDDGTLYVREPDFGTWLHNLFHPKPKHPKPSATTTTAAPTATPTTATPSTDASSAGDAREYYDEEDLMAREYYDEEDLMAREYYDEEDLMAREYYDEEDLMAREYYDEEDLMAREYYDEEDLMAREYADFDDLD